MAVQLVLESIYKAGGRSLERGRVKCSIRVKGDRLALLQLTGEQDNSSQTLSINHFFEMNIVKLTF